MRKHHRLKSSVMFWRVLVGNAHARHSDAKTFLFLSFLMLFFVFPSSTFSYVILYHFLTFFFCVSSCYSLCLPSITSSFVFPYVILYLFLLLPYHLLGLNRKEGRARFAIREEPTGADRKRVRLHGWGRGLSTFVL